MFINILISSGMNVQQMYHVHLVNEQKKNLGINRSFVLYSLNKSNVREIKIKNNEIFLEKILTIY